MNNPNIQHSKNYVVHLLIGLLLLAILSLVTSCTPSKVTQAKEVGNGEVVYQSFWCTVTEIKVDSVEYLIASGNGTAIIKHSK